MEQLGLLFFMLLGYAEQNGMVVALFLVGALVLNGLALSRPGSYFNKKSIKITAFGFLIMLGVLFVSLPSLTGSSFAFMGYWLDWALLVMMTVGYAAAAVVWIYPVVKLYQATAQKS